MQCDAMPCLALYYIILYYIILYYIIQLLVPSWMSAVTELVLQQFDKTNSIT